MDPTALIARKRPRKGRVRREPIDLERLAAEFAATAEPARSEHDIIRALEAEVERVHAANAPEETVEVEAEDPFGIHADTDDEISLYPDPDPLIEPAPASPNTVGLPAEQLQAWLEQVQDDLGKVEARVEYLQREQARLQSQHQLVAELISASTPI